MLNLNKLNKFTTDFQENNIFTKRSKLTKLIWSSDVGRICRLQMGDFMNVKVTCCIFSKIWKASAAFYECMVFFAKNISKSCPKDGNRASVGFYFSGGTTSKENLHFI